MNNEDWDIVYTGDFFAIEKHKTKGFEHAVRPPGLRLVLKKDGRIVLTKEYRSEYNAFDYRLPGGKVFDSLEAFLAVRGDEQKIEDAVCS
jgi:hypothetical protein